MKAAQLILRRSGAITGRCVSVANRHLPSKLGSGIPVQNCMAITATARAFSAPTTTLIDILAREEAEEVDTGNTEMPQELADLRASLEKDYRIVEEEAMTTMFLTDSKVQISFHCQDTVEEVTEEAYEDGEEPSDPVRFTVTDTKAGKTLFINCISEAGEVKIEGVGTTSLSPDAVHANQGNLPEKSLYQGPDFLELAEDLQEAFYGFLENDCGVHTDVASFVAMQTDYQEQMQYVQFLKDVQTVLK